MFKQLYTSSVEMHENVTFFRQHFGYLYRSVLALILLVCFLISAFVPWTFRLMLNSSPQQSVPIFLVLVVALLWAMKNLQFQEFINPTLASSVTEFKLSKGSPSPKNSTAVASKTKKAAVTEDDTLTEDWIFVYNTAGEPASNRKFCLYEKQRVGFGNPYAEDYKVLAIGSMQWFNLQHGWWTPYAINKATRPTTFSIEPVFPNTSAVQIMENLSDNLMEVTSEFRLQVGTGPAPISAKPSSQAGEEMKVPVPTEKLYLTQRSEGGFLYCYDYTLEEHLSEMYTWRLKRWIHKEGSEDPESELWYLQNIGTGDYLKAERSWYSGTKNLSEAAKFCVYS